MTIQQEAIAIRKKLLSDSFYVTLHRDGKTKMLIQAFTKVVRANVAKRYCNIAKELGIIIVWGNGGAQTRRLVDLRAQPTLVEGRDFIHVTDYEEVDELIIEAFLIRENII